jgi:hypothetical protein
MVDNAPKLRNPIAPSPSKEQHRKHNELDKAFYSSEKISEHMKNHSNDNEDMLNMCRN